MKLLSLLFLASLFVVWCFFPTSITAVGQITPEAASTTVPYNSLANTGSYVLDIWKVQGIIGGVSIMLGSLLYALVLDRKKYKLLLINVSHLMMTTGVFFLTLTIIQSFLPQQIIQAESIAFNRSSPSISATNFAKSEEFLPVRLQVGELIEIEIEPAKFEHNEWIISDKKVSYWTGSALPGWVGNTVLYGHNKKEILGNLNSSKVGDQITITVKNGQVFSYTIEEMKEVTPDQIQYIFPTNEQVLTIYTCSGWLDSKRLVVRAGAI